MTSTDWLTPPQKSSHDSSEYEWTVDLLIVPLLILLTLPLMVIVALLVKLQDRGPVLYKGIRLGRNKKPFIIYKFRTLVPGSEQIIREAIFSETLGSRANLVTPIGRFLRLTRLDELPQLFNIIKGDMALIGPRPERPEIYEKICKNIKGYDKRFAVKPGLVGYSQLLTPHTAPRKIRTLIDNRLIRRRNMLSDIRILSFATLVLLRNGISGMHKFMWSQIWMQKILHQYTEKRLLCRVKLRDAHASILMDIDGDCRFIEVGDIVDINEEYILLYATQKINDGDFVLRMNIADHNDITNKYRIRHAICNAKTHKAIETNVFVRDSMANLGGGAESIESVYKYIIRYEPISPLNHYMVHQYFLKYTLKLY